ncbi:MAG: sigma-70 family RNA polymerase sigma factor [Gemmatimonadota bacterium]|nr:hypothetical protein [Gemmatimonadota bacterium]MDP6461392.1 sigma-70 family RNA polymerase sigma factor [Gemmatimonadota bacterium]
MAPPRAAPSNREDSTLLGFRDGCPKAHATVRRWAEDVVWFTGYGFAASDREETVQDALGDLWRAVSVPNFVLRSGLRPLVRTIATARCIDRLRKRRPTVEVNETLASEGAAPYERLLRRDEQARLQWALRGLDRRCRELIQLRYFEELPFSRIAEKFDRAESTMRVGVFQCLKKVRAFVRRWEDPPGGSA